MSSVSPAADLSTLDPRALSWNCVSDSSGGHGGSPPIGFPVSFHCHLKLTLWPNITALRSSNQTGSFLGNKCLSFEAQRTWTTSECFHQSSPYIDGPQRPNIAR